MRKILKYAKENWIATVLIIMLAFAFLSTEYRLESKTSQFNSSQMSLGDLKKNTVSFDEKVKCKSYEKEISDSLIFSEYMIDALYRLYYSPTMKTCIAAEYHVYPAHDSVPKSMSISLTDVLTGETILQRNIAPSSRYWDAEAELDIEITKIQ